MSKGKGNDAKTPAKVDNAVASVTTTPKLSTPETAMADICEHYFHAATQKAPRVNTRTP